MLPARDAIGCGFALALLAGNIAVSFAASTAAVPPDLGARLASTCADRGARLYAAGDLEGAIAELRRACALAPRDPQVRFMMGNAWSRAGKFEAAIPEYREAVALRPGHADTHLNLGFALYHTGRKEEAREAWRQAVERSRRDPLARAALALGELAGGDLDAALFHLSIAVYLEPRCATKEYYLQDYRWGESGRKEVDHLVALIDPEGW